MTGNQSFCQLMKRRGHHIRRAAALDNFPWCITIT
jgi:hypothetical protein